MNYKERIEALIDKGIMTEEQATRLNHSISIPQIETTQKRSYTMQWIGALLALLIGIYWVTTNTQTQPRVENVSEILNTPASAGIQTGSQMMMIVLLGLVVGYLILYVIAFRRHGYLLNLHRDISFFRKAIHVGELFKKELSQKLETLLGNAYTHKESLESQAMIQLESDDQTTQLVIQTYKEVEYDLKAQKEQLLWLEAECSKRTQHFPDTLALLVGKFPPCHTKETT